ncbi:MAG: tRNA (adenosine(37)-N6)-threonylcarbamoyltransferase complex dimerization subunit type 1 TsaB [Acidobacteria bacterium]|nr:tRNA (adenosine(37)-N6)-threonylcarbamoyltransferase complex dimerization subunit type 1 TsaB [Acidobacteriota bacterium]MYF13089.1 tRNA (adenosine(37)-N6)-threonylcarbamoyltransferase complex dimerization subunit type 1 TsaB [Acidobacteriota bacterium]MYI97881.1 tRNA (adenosine(37)-N6)-threonylcarbamoyltransferase complex dimerization subunit type 1 TsaB [Acidobacteriota bacterium]
MAGPHREDWPQGGETHEFALAPGAGPNASSVALARRTGAADPPIRRGKGVRSTDWPKRRATGTFSCSRAAPTGRTGRRPEAGAPNRISRALRELEPESVAAAPISGPVLALDTTGTLGSVALGLAGPSDAVTADAVETFEPSNRHSRSLLPAIRRVMAPAGLGTRDLALVVATRGPGSFTGLRIGLATAQGFALAAGIPAAGVSSLDAAALADAAASGPGLRRLVIVDALRGELFAALYDGAGPDALVRGPCRLLPHEAVGRAAEHGAARICGPAVLRYRDAIVRGRPEVEIVEERRPLAPAALGLGLRAARRGETTLEPLYLREPDIHGRSVTL